MEYKLKNFKVGDFQDQHGNTWCDAILEGVGEPVKWVVKDPTKVTVGQSYYGEVKEMTSKAGKPYLRFYKQQKPDQAPQTGGQQTDEYWEDRNNSIRAQFAIKTAVELLKNPEATDITEELIEGWAKKFYNMVDRVATDKPSEAPKNVVSVASDDDFPDEPHLDPPEINDIDTDKPINLDEIPF
jgi:hypothetical protein